MFICIVCGKQRTEMLVARVHEGRPPASRNRWRRVGYVCDNRQCESRLESVVAKAAIGSVSDMSKTLYIEPEDGWATPCCGIQMFGDITENETLCPYCKKTLEFADEDEDEDEE